jgi:hypothetical protein
MSQMVQKTCNSSESQMFAFNTAGDGTFVIYSGYGRALEVSYASPYNDAPLTQGDGTWADHRQFTLTPIIAGEPHRLSYSHSTNDAACGKYFWYDVAQPNGQPLRAPADTYVQLMFAGGKSTPTGADINPFIAQQVSGNQVAIDPSGYMNAGSLSGASGSCLATDLLYDVTKAAGGTCCIRYNGSYGTLKLSTWSPTTYVCSL